MPLLTQPETTLIHGPDGHLAAVVEVKNREDLSVDMASVLRKSRLAHGILPDVRFFLLVSQDRGHLWVKKDGSDETPTLTFSMTDVVRRYLPEGHIDGRLRNAELDFLVRMWLNELAEHEDAFTVEPEKSLESVGFVDAVRRGVITWVSI